MAYDLSDYKDVAERIRDFRDLHPYGSLQSEIVSLPSPDLSFIVVKAFAYRAPDDERPGVGLAWEPFPGKTPYTKDSELQNAETSAWGRAIVAALASDTKQGIASADEIRARRTAGAGDNPSSSPPSPASAPSSGVTEAHTETPSAPTSTVAPESSEAETKGEGEAPKVSASANKKNCPHATWSAAPRAGWELCDSCGNARKAAA